MSNDSILLSEITNYNLRRRLSTLVAQDIETSSKISKLKLEQNKEEIERIFQQLNLKSIKKPDTSESTPDGWKASYIQTTRTSLNRKTLLSLKLVCPCCRERLEGPNKIITPAVLEEATDVSISKPFVKIVASKKEENDNGE